MHIWCSITGVNICKCQAIIETVTGSYTWYTGESLLAVTSETFTCGYLQVTKPRRPSTSLWVPANVKHGFISLTACSPSEPADCARRHCITAVHAQKPHHSQEQQQCIERPHICCLGEVQAVSVGKLKRETLCLLDHTGACSHAHHPAGASESLPDPPTCTNAHMGHMLALHAFKPWHA